MYPWVISKSPGRETATPIEKSWITDRPTADIQGIKVLPKMQQEQERGGWSGRQKLVANCSSVTTSVTLSQSFLAR